MLIESDQRIMFYNVGVINYLFYKFLTVCNVLFSAFPAPLIFGFIADSACLVHQQSCDRQGACLYYDLETFRYRFHGTASLLKLGGLLCLVGALICSRKIASKARREKKDTALRISAPENQYHLIPVIDVETSKFDTLDDFGNRSEM